MLDALLPTILPELQSIAGLILTAIVSWVAFQVKKRLGVGIQIKQIEENDKLRDLLTTAITTGVKAAMLKATVGTGPEALAEAAIDHVVQSIPDTITKLGPSHTVLKNRALSILFDLQHPKP